MSLLPITQFLRKGAGSKFIKKGQRTTFLHRERSSAKGSSSEVRFRNVANTRTLGERSLNYLEVILWVTKSIWEEYKTLQ